METGSIAWEWTGRQTTRYRDGRKQARRLAIDSIPKEDRDGLIAFRYAVPEIWVHVFSFYRFPEYGRRTSKFSAR